MYFTEVEPISTYVDFGEREFLVADERGYEHLLYKMADTFLFTAEDGEILDTRLKLNKVNRNWIKSNNFIVQAQLILVNNFGISCTISADFEFLSFLWIKSSQENKHMEIF